MSEVLEEVLPLLLVRDGVLVEDLGHVPGGGDLRVLGTVMCSGFTGHAGGREEADEGGAAHRGHIYATRVLLSSSSSSSSTMMLPPSSG